MDVSVEATSLERVRLWRDMDRLEVSCQIIHDSIHDRGSHLAFGARSGTSYTPA